MGVLEVRYGLLRLGNLVGKVNPTARRATATLSFDELKFELRR